MAEDMNTAFTADADDWSDITADSFSDIEDDAQGAPDTETQSSGAAPEIEQNDGGQDADAAQPGENEEQQTQTDGQLFELKHLGETKNVNRDEVVTLAQKGMDYDRVTEKNTQLETQVSEQKQQLAQLTEHENALQELAKQSGTTVEELVENMLIAVTKSKYGIDDDGMALERVKLDRERRALDQERAALAPQKQEQEQQAATLGKQIKKIQNQQINVAAIEKIEAKPIPFSTKIAVEREDFEHLSTLAKKYVAAEKKESKLQKTLDAANRLIAKLKAEIAGLKQELSEYKSVRGKLRTSDLERENAELRGKIQRYEDVIQHNNLWHFFRPRREKTAMRDDAR